MEGLEAQEACKGVPIGQLIEELMFLTGCDELRARQLLMECKLELHSAVDAHFDQQREAKMSQRRQGTAVPPPLPPLSCPGRLPERDTGFSMRTRASGTASQPEPEPEPAPEATQPTFRVVGRSILRAGPDLHSPVVRELSVGEILVATDIVLLPSALPPTPSALTDARLFATATRPRIHFAGTANGGGWSSLRANNGTLLLEEVLSPPHVSATGAMALPQDIVANSSDVSFVCTLRSPSMVLAGSTGGIAGRVRLHEQRMTWHNVSTPTKATSLGWSQAGGLASSISIPYSRIGAVTVGKEKAQQLVFLELQVQRAGESSGNWKERQQQNCLLGPGGRWCLGFGGDTQRRSIFLRALGQAIVDAKWVLPTTDSAASTDDAKWLMAPQYCGYARCSEWLSVRGRAAMGNISVELAQEVAHFQAEVIAAAPVTSTSQANRLLCEGRRLVHRVRDIIFMQQREEMKRGLLSCPAWLEGGYRTIQGSTPQQTVRYDGFVRLLSVGGGLLPAEPARGRRYLLLRADIPVLEMYTERHPEAAVSALASLPLALFQEDDVVSHHVARSSVSPEPRTTETTRNGSSSSRTGEGRSSDVGRASSTSTASSSSDIEVVRTPREAIEAGMTATAGLQHDDCWSGSWRFEKVDEVSLAALSTWGQITLGRYGATDTLAVVNGAGHAFEMQLPSAAIAVRWRTELLAASSGSAYAISGSGVGLQSYLARGRRGGISGLSKSGWFWCERGKAGGGKWARRWLELDPDGELRIFNKKAARGAVNFPPDGNQILEGCPLGRLGDGSVVTVDCALATIRSPKNARKDHPHAFRLETTNGAKDASGNSQELKFILEPMDSQAVTGPFHTPVDATLDQCDGMSLHEEELVANPTYLGRCGPRKSVEAETAEWVAAIRAAGAAAAARSAQRQMALDDDVDSVLLGTIHRLCEEAVLLPVLEPLLEAAATTTAPEFVNDQQTLAATFDPQAVRCGRSDEQTVKAAAVRWLRSSTADADNVLGHQGQQSATDDVQQAEHADDWVILGEGAATVLEASYRGSERDAAVPVALCVGQISDVGRSDTVEYYANFATMTLAVKSDDDDGTNGSGQPDVFMLRRQETALHAALRLTSDLSQNHEVFLLRPTHQSPTSWSAALRCFRGLGGLSTGHGSACSCSGNVALLPGSIEGHLVKLRDEINAQYIMERLLPGRDPDAGPLPSRVLGADDLFPILCFIVARGADIETTRPIHTRLTTLLAWCSSMADGGGGEGEWMVQSLRAALTLLIENASVATQLGAAS